jgi:4-alpha-glucanotransferase
MGLGTEARMNYPGRAGGNWDWRFTWDMLTDDTRSRLKQMTTTYGR